MRRLFFLFAPVAAVLAAMTLRADGPPRYSIDELACRSWNELESIYRSAAPGSAPSGFMRGRVVFPPCAVLAGPREKVSNALWQGKHFCGDGLINQWRGVKFIKGAVSPGESWLDGRPAHILDYQNTSVLWNDVRDETREVSPGVYIGLMYLRRCPEAKLKLMFLLESDVCR
jgi:hypothetical protein